MSHLMWPTSRWVLGTVVGTATGQTTIFTPAAEFLVSAIYAIPRTLTTVTTPPTITVGTAGASWNQTVTAVVLGATALVPQVLSLVVAGTLIPAGTAVKANVSVAAVATAYTFDVVAVGVYT